MHSYFHGSRYHRFTRFIVGVSVVAVAGLASACGASKTTWVLETPAQSSSAQAAPTSHTGMQVQSDSFADGATIPLEFVNTSAGGKNQSPQISWNAIPKAKSYAVTVFDKDAKNGAGIYHWIVINISPTINSLAANASATGLPQGAVEIAHGMTDVHYQGPFPPENSLHHYVVTIYALNKDAISHTDAATVIDQIHQSTIASSSFTGTYETIKK